MTSWPLWLHIVLLACAASVGALIRHSVTTLGTTDKTSKRRRITGINAAGSFVAGVVFGADWDVAVILAVGLLGSLTTFSTVAVWIAGDIRGRDPVAAMKVVAGHLLLGVPAVLVGFVTGQLLS